MDLSNENVIHVKKDGVEYLQFRRLLEYNNIITHAYTLGVNISFKTDAFDKTFLPPTELKKVLNNYKKICSSLGTDYKRVVKTRQEHTKNIAIVNKKINIDKPDINLEEYANIDGFITNNPNLILTTTNADCILFLLFDPVKRVIANIHSGWSGTLQEISVEAIKKMIQDYGCNPKDIICCMCPSIRKCHFEVEEDIAERFYNKFKSLEKINEIIEHNSNTNKWNIDTVLINKIILKNIGLKPENIIDSGICSVCNSNIIHSFRVEKEKFGHAIALIELKK